MLNNNGIIQLSNFNQSNEFREVIFMFIVHGKSI